LNINNSGNTGNTSNYLAQSSAAAVTVLSLASAPANETPAEKNSLFSHMNFMAMELGGLSSFDYRFGLLDKLRARECFEISVLYMPANTEIGCAESIRGERSVREFVQALGWKVDIYIITQYIK